MRMRSLLMGITVIAISSLSLDAYAQEGEGGIGPGSSGGGIEVTDTPTVLGVRSLETVPDRALTLKSSSLFVGGGPQADLSKDAALETWVLPIGGGYGILKGLEVGADIDLLLKPFDGGDLLNRVRIYGRYVVFKEMLAAELSIHIPTDSFRPWGLELLLPLHWKHSSMEVFGQGRFAYYSGEVDAGSVALPYSESGLGVVASVLVKLPADLFGVVDLGLLYSSSTFEFPGGNTIDNSNNQLPLGLGVGYKIMTDMLVKATFSFADIAQEDANGDFNGLDQRFFGVSIIQFMGIGG